MPKSTAHSGRFASVESPRCMYRTPSPAHGQAFCHEHYEFLQQQAPDVPTGLRDFLRFCGALNDGKYLIVKVYSGFLYLFLVL